MHVYRVEIARVDIVTIAKVKQPRPEITYSITSTNQQRQFKILQIYLQIKN
jgi:hypothetical protein